MSNIVDFIYLNPKVHVDNNLVTLETASNFYYSSSNNSLFLSGTVPENFNENVYLADIASRIPLNDFGSLNNNIFDSMILDGFNSNYIIQNSSYKTCINKNIYLVSSNTFSTDSNFLLSDFGITSNDSIYVLKNFSEKLYLGIKEIINDTKFIVSHYTELRDYNANYKLMGQRLYDSTRLAVIKYLTHSNDMPIVNMDDSFNPDLYRILYPEYKLYPNEQLYIDYLTTTSNIGKTSELASIISSNVDQFQNVVVQQSLTLDFESLSGYLDWDNIRIRGISQDSTTNTDLLDPTHEYLITERAIKTYVDIKSAISKDFVYGVTNDASSNYVPVSGKGSIHDFIDIGEKLTTIDSCGTIYGKNSVFDNSFREIKTFPNTVVKYYDNNNVDVDENYTYILNSNTFFMINYDDFKNIFKVIGKTNTNGVLRLSCEKISSKINIPINSNIITKEFSVLEESYISKYSNQDLMNQNMVNYDGVNYSLPPLYNDTTSVILIDNILVENSKTFHFLTRNNDNTFESKSGIVNTLIPYTIIRTKHEYLEIKIDSYVVHNANTLSITLYYPYSKFNTYSYISDYSFLILYNKVWKIESTEKINLENGSIKLKISTFDKSTIGYDTVLFGFQLIDNNIVKTNQNTNVYFFSIKDHKKTLECPQKINILDTYSKRNGYIAYINDSLHLDTHIICSKSNVNIRDSLIVANNELMLKNYLDGVMVENLSPNGVLYLGSSNAFIDKNGNMRVRGQIAAPVFSTTTSSNTLVGDLNSRVEFLERIVEKYNLYL